MTPTDDTYRLTADTVLIVGAGLAGLYCALRLRRPSLVISTDTPGRGGSSVSAQGGIAAALAPDDTPSLHAADTIAAGAGLSDPAAVRVLTEEGPSHIAALGALGVPFDRDANGILQLGLEAAHSRPRVARVRGDLAGREIMKAVGRAAIRSDRVTLKTGLTAQALVRCENGRVGGVRTLDSDGRAVEILASETILATGGVGGVYAVTTNPPSALGDGVAMAAVAGATIADPEFVQFHPTAIDVGRDPAPLATEALRGEGARLVDTQGRPLVDDPAGDLAARDIVARAVHNAITQQRGAFLDASRTVGAAFPRLFPTVFEACRQAGLDPRSAPIPVAPAAHYHMGGVATDLTGRTNLPGLWALGEAASTGVHGANRLASNSLLEAVVFAARAAEMLDQLAGSDVIATVPEPTPTPLRSDGLVTLRRAMGRHAGVLRTSDDLKSLIATIDELEATDGRSTAVVTARVIATSALGRVESRGAHFRVDAPQRSTVSERTFFSLVDAR